MEMQGHASLKPRTMLPRLPAGNLKTKQDAGSRVQVLLEIIKDVDELMGTQKLSLFGKWIADARGWGTTEDEKAKNEFNARNLLVMIPGKTPQYEISKSQILTRSTRQQHMSNECGHSTVI